MLGPFAIKSTSKAVAKIEIASLRKHKILQLKTDPEAKVVTVGKFAYLLTREEFLKTDNPADKYRLKDGLRVKRRAKV